MAGLQVNHMMWQQEHGHQQVQKTDHQFHRVHLLGAARGASIASGTVPQFPKPIQLETVARSQQVVDYVTDVQSGFIADWTAARALATLDASEKPVFSRKLPCLNAHL